jgi:hypothetical protein
MHQCCHALLSCRACCTTATHTPRPIAVATSSTIPACSCCWPWCREASSRGPLLLHLLHTLLLLLLREGRPVPRSAPGALLSWQCSTELSPYAWLLLQLLLCTKRSLLLIWLLLRHWRHALEAWHLLMLLLLTWRASREAWRRHALLRWRAQLACVMAMSSSSSSMRPRDQCTYAYDCKCMERHVQAHHLQALVHQPMHQQPQKAIHSKSGS